MGKLLWSPSRDRIDSTNMWRFMQFVNEQYNQDLSDYDSLYQWSINEMEAFWSTVWEFVKVKASETYREVIDDVNKILFLTFLILMTAFHVTNLGVIVLPW